MKKGIFVFVGLFALVFYLSAQGTSDIKKALRATQGEETTLNPSAPNVNIEELLKKRREGLGKSAQEVNYIPIEGEVNDSLYIVGPHDHIVATMSLADGEEPKVIDIDVAPDGEAIIPNWGGLHIAGMSFAAAKEKIRSAIREVYRPIRLTINLTDIRVFRVQVCGFVRMPGGYSLTAVHRVSDAIDAAGGIAPLGDMSDVLVIRNGDTLAYNISLFRLNGDKTSNPFLLDGDVIVVHSVEAYKHFVLTGGAVKRQGRVGIRNGEKLSSFLVRVLDGRHNVDVEHILLSRGGQDTLIDIASGGGNIPLMDGDRLIVPMITDSIYVGGFVQQPGAYPYIPSADVKVYAAMAGGPSENGSIGSICVYRQGKKIKLRKNTVLMPGDVIVVNSSLYYKAKELFTTLGQAASILTAIYLIGIKK